VRVTWTWRKEGNIKIQVSGEETELGTCMTCGCVVPTIRIQRHQDWHDQAEEG
jgi:hypothetical protein